MNSIKGMPKLCVEEKLIIRKKIGTRRLPFMVACIALFFIISDLAATLIPAIRTASVGNRTTLETGIPQLLLLLFLPVSTYVVDSRVINIGLNRWWTVTFLMPVVNLIVLFFCLLLPEGFGAHQATVKPGKRFLCLVFSYIALFLIFKVIKVPIPFQ